MAMIILAEAAIRDKAGAAVAVLRTGGQRRPRKAECIIDETNRLHQGGTAKSAAFSDAGIPG